MNKSNEEQLNKTGNELTFENNANHQQSQANQKGKNGVINESPRVKAKKLDLLNDSDEFELQKHRYNDKTKSVDILDGIVRQEITYKEENVNLSKSETLQLSADHKKFQSFGQQSKNISTNSFNKSKEQTAQVILQNQEKNSNSQGIKENQDIIKEIKNLSPNSIQNVDQYLLEDLQDVYSKESFRNNQIPAQTKSEPEAEHFSIDKRLESLENQDQILGELEEDLVQDLKQAVALHKSQKQSNEQNDQEKRT